MVLAKQIEARETFTSGLDRAKISGPRLKVRELFSLFEPSGSFVPSSDRKFSLGVTLKRSHDVLA